MSQLQLRYPPASGGSGGGLTPTQVTNAVIAALDAVFPTDVKGPALFHSAASVNVQAVSGAYVAIGTGAIPAGTKAVQISSSLGQPISIKLAANAGAAPASTRGIDLLSAGGPIMLQVLPTVGEQLFVRSLTATAISTQYLVVNFVG